MRQAAIVIPNQIEKPQRPHGESSVFQHAQRPRYSSDQPALSRRHEDPFDRALARRLADRDETVLRQILTNYGPKVITRLRKNLGSLNDYDLDDILQSALISLWQSADRYDPTRSSLKVYFYVISYHKAIDLIRRRGTFERLKERLREAPTPATDAPHETNPALVVLRQVLSELPEPDRRIALASTTGGHWAKRLARELDVPPVTLHYKRFRLFQRIRRIMNARSIADDMAT